MPNSIRIAIQSSGRLRDGSLAYLKSLGIVLPTRIGRSLLVQAKNVLVEIAFVRHRDIPRYVQSGVAQYGIVGANILYEYNTTVIPRQRLPFGDCRLVIAVPRDSGIKTIGELTGLRIATAYPNSLKKFLQANGIAATIVEMGGSVEIAPELDLAEVICDVTQTGTTLQTHGLVQLHTILESTATVITAHQYQPIIKDIVYAYAQ
ncbi:MAG: ATP phosphoribosyltransferase [uncultured bacterium]|nr:MAG: ATP phosphoribosyltransferase [uncultured bacterium]HBY74119.1 ATP phosphoribosyltransferase [Candidatus Kerfeldbacteria bacterium]